MKGIIILKFAHFLPFSVCLCTRRAQTMYSILLLPIARSPLLIFIFPCALTAGIYRERLRERFGCDVTEFGFLSSRIRPVVDFDSGLFDCSRGNGGSALSLFNLFCGPVRLAVNASTTGCNDFWVSLLTSVIFLPMFPIIGYMTRLHIRTCYNMEPHPIRDWFEWLLCCCCVITQESKFIDAEFGSVEGFRGSVIGHVI
jgi:Cys-rich protein (TIGR01571 family)